MSKSIRYIKFNKLRATVKALAKAGGTTEHASFIRLGTNAAKLIRFIEEQRAAVDCDTDVSFPECFQYQNCTVRPEDQLPRAVRGRLEFDPTKILLYLDESQKDGKSIVGHELARRLAAAPVFNLVAFDLFLNNHKLLPAALRDGKIEGIPLWGTIFRQRDGSPHVFCFKMYGNSEPFLESRRLDEQFDDHYPAVILG